MTGRRVVATLVVSCAVLTGCKLGEPPPRAETQSECPPRPSPMGWITPDSGKVTGRRARVKGCAIPMYYLRIKANGKNQWYYVGGRKWYDPFPVGSDWTNYR